MEPPYPDIRNAKSSPEYVPPLMETTMYGLPCGMFVIGEPDCGASTESSHFPARGLVVCAQQPATGSALSQIITFDE